MSAGACSTLPIVRSAVVGIAVVVMGCGDVRAPITIVVETDRARAREDQGRMQELREGVQGDRREVEAARGELEAARRRLEEVSRAAAKGTATAQQQQEQQALVARLEAQAARPAGEGVTRVELDDALAAHEARLVARVAAEVDRAIAGRTSSPTAASTTSPTRERPEAEVTRLVDRARAALATKALVIGDLDGGTASVDRVEGALSRGDVAGALAVATDLAAQADAAQLDRALLRRKYDRINTRAKKEAAGSARHTAAVAGLRAATDAIGAGDLPKANGHLNEVERDLR